MGDGGELKQIDQGFLISPHIKLLMFIPVEVSSGLIVHAVKSSFANRNEPKNPEKRCNFQAKNPKSRSLVSSQIHFKVVYMFICIDFGVSGADSQ